MILTTTPTIEGCPIKKYLGIVTGEAIIGANVLRDLSAQLHDFFGGRTPSYEQVLYESRESSLREMKERAHALGANAIVGIDIEYETVSNSGSILMVATSGTAVII